MPRVRIAAAALIAGVALIGAVYYVRAVPGRAPSAMFGYLPATGASALVYVDAAGLRRWGPRERGGAPRDPDYAAFVRQTHFDYRRDLDAAAGAFVEGGEFFLLRGRFDWDGLKSYALGQGGRCDGDVCRMNGSRPDRRISFRRMGWGFLALAAGPDGDAVRWIRRDAGGAGFAVPRQPAWLILSRSGARTWPTLPEGAQAFSSALEDARELTVAVEARGENLELSLRVVCKDTEAADLLERRLREATAALRGELANRRAKPGAAGLGDVLVAGTFRLEGRAVLGEWPVSRAFVEAVASGAAE